VYCCSTMGHFGSVNMGRGRPSTRDFFGWLVKAPQNKNNLKTYKSTMKSITKCNSRGNTKCDTNLTAKKPKHESNSRPKSRPSSQPIDQPRSQRSGPKKGQLDRLSNGAPRSPGGNFARTNEEIVNPKEGRKGEKCEKEWCP